MSKIVIIGAGAMGTAFAYPCTDNKHDVNIVGTHLENKTIENLNTNRFHTGLNIEVINSIKFSKYELINDVFKTTPDLIVIGVSSKGIDYLLSLICLLVVLRRPFTCVPVVLHMGHATHG